MGDVAGGGSGIGGDDRRWWTGTTMRSLTRGGALDSPLVHSSSPLGDDDSGGHEAAASVTATENSRLPE
ncbi:hypothetical protein AKJ16_DCAP09291 [Drosera capensis]